MFDRKILAFLTELSSFKLERRGKPVLHEDDSIIPNTARRYIVNMARHTDTSGTQCNIFHPTASSVL